MSDTLDSKVPILSVVKKKEVERPFITQQFVSEMASSTSLRYVDYGNYSLLRMLQHTHSKYLRIY